MPVRMEYETDNRQWNGGCQIKRKKKIKQKKQCLDLDVDQY